MLVWVSAGAKGLSKHKQVTERAGGPGSHRRIPKVYNSALFEGATQIAIA